MNSVLLIGDISFTSGITTQVRGFDSLTVTTLTEAKEALPMLSQNAPDVLIAQANKLEDGSVSKTFAFSIKRPSSYFVVIDDAVASGAELGLSTHYVSELHLERSAFALEAGADAYLWLPPIYDETSLSNERLADDRLAISVRSEPTSAIESAQGDGHLKVKPQVWTQSQPAKSEQDENALAHPRPLLLHPNQRRLIQAHIQIGLNRAQRYRDLSRINDWLSAVALVDALTQLNNRRSFDLELPQKIKVARAKKAPLSLMVIDIDYFKSVNDRHGHLVGDDVLKMLAKRLLKNMRFYDTPFRYGGEEFVVTLSSTDLSEGVAIAQRLRQSIAQVPFEISESVSSVGKLPLTVSIGITELMEGDDSHGRSCLNRADQCLLKAKAEGRNKVVSS